MNLQNNRDLNKGVLHLVSKFGYSSLNRWRVIMRTCSWLTDTHTDAGDDNTKVFCILCPNLVILAWIGDELSCEHALDWQTHTHTQMQAMTIPAGQNWPWVKIYENIMYNQLISFLNKRKILYQYQSGFSQHHLIYIAQIIVMDQSLFVLKEGKFVLDLFLDFSEAFDTINHDIFFHTLALKW